jgi:DNA gyrase subunit A
VIGIVRVDDDDELIMMSARGKIQRIAAGEISTIGRNTQGVRIMSLDEGDTLAAVVRVPKEENGEAEVDAAPHSSAVPLAELPVDETAGGTADETADETDAEPDDSPDSTEDEPQ